MKKIWRWIKIVYSLTYIVGVVILIVSLGFTLSGVLVDQKALVNTATINSITLVIALISLPGIFVQLLSLLDVHFKKTFTATTKCPKCKHLVELKLSED